MSLLIKNIKQLWMVDERPTAFRRGIEMAQVNMIENAYLLSVDGKIASYGAMIDSPLTADKIINATGKMVFPSFCDSHTHLVFAATREEEFVDRIKGATYAEIAEKGGGILNSAHRLCDKPEDELYNDAFTRLQEIKAYGTGAVEIKSGYGLTVDGELKILRVIKRLKESSTIPIKATFLGAHALPLAYKNDRAAYIKLITDEMLPKIAEEGLADYIDVFCETNYFTVDEMEVVLKAGTTYGIRPKVHVNQFTSIGGIQAAIKHKALSVDHLEEMTSADILALKGSSTMATLLPSCSFFLGIPFGPARKMISNDLAIALASDYNPGSTPSGNLTFVWSLACIKMKLLPQEALCALTQNAAYAMGLENEMGTITIGKRANLIITKPMDSLARVPYSFGSDMIDAVLVDGKENN